MRRTALIGLALATAVAGCGGSDSSSSSFSGAQGEAATKVTFRLNW